MDLLGLCVCVLFMLTSSEEFGVTFFFYYYTRSELNNSGQVFTSVFYTSVGYHQIHSIHFSVCLSLQNIAHK